MSLPFDPAEARMKVGIEIHQQLETGTKLFCSCPPSRSEDLPYSFDRRLRPSQSELGRIDPAAVFEFNKGKVNRYRWSPGSSCLVEMDEEPPHPISERALETSVLISLMLGAKVVEEIHVMRKLVIDGSNTTGFQRTAVVGLGGDLPFDGGAKHVGVQSISVEEDSSRVLGEDDECRMFALDRLGIPLVEIALDPLVGRPEDVEGAALQLGRALRSTGRVARGLGTIRQDLNVSVMGGEVVEVKGVQKLSLIARVVRYEGTRQMGLLRIADAIRARGLAGVSWRTCDVTGLLASTSSPALSRALRGGGDGVVRCVVAEGLAGLIGHEPFPGIRLGKELAEIARTNSLGGVIHSDEFRKQGVSESEEAELRRAAGAGEADALVLVAGPRERADVVAGLVGARLASATRGVPKETRAATDDGETRYLRPRPGAARMYPETDIPEMLVGEGRLAEVARALPVPWEERVASLTERHSLSRDMALQLYDAGEADAFEALASELRLDRSVIASVLVEMPARLAREGVDESRITEELLRGVLRALEAGEFAKEASVEVLREVASGRSDSIGAAVKSLGLTGMSEAELRSTIDSVVERNRSLVLEKGERSFALLMGEVMKTARGRVDGRQVSRLLKERISELRDGAAAAAR